MEIMLKCLVTIENWHVCYVVYMTFGLEVKESSGTSGQCLSCIQTSSIACILSFVDRFPHNFQRCRYASLSTSKIFTQQTMTCK